MKRGIFLLPLLFLGFVFSLYAQEGFSDIFGDDSSTGETKTEEQAASPFSISGSVGAGSEWYFSDGPEDQAELLGIFSDLAVQFKTKKAEAIIRLCLPPTFSLDDVTLDRIIDEVSIKAFFDFMQVDVGFLKLEWGQGDGIHVIDPLNPLDQRDGLTDDLNALKRAELMAHLSFFPISNLKIEAVYMPFFHPYTVAVDGRWAVADLSILPNLQPAPDTETAEYSQLAARITGTIGFVDLGALYYYGFMNEPGYMFTTEFLGGDPYDPANYLTTTDIVFTRAQLFAAEAAAALGPFTLRGELGFWLSEDSDATVEYQYNNRFCWLGGVNFKIPGTPFFFSVQEIGQYVLDFDDQTATDVDNAASIDSAAHTNTLIAAIEGSFFKDKLKLRLGGMWVIESDSYMLMPALYFYPNDNVEFKLAGMIIDGRDSGSNPYYAWRDNDSLELSIKYTF